MIETTSSESFFEAKYRDKEDPWCFGSNPYEQTRYSTIVRALQGRRFERVFEPGCSIGVLTQQLAAFSRHVHAIDISRTAVERAQERCRQLANVTIKAGALPKDIPAAQFDLVVFSEIGYYFSAIALANVVVELVSRIPQNGVFLAAHWLGASSDHRLSGDAVHKIVGATPGLKHSGEQRFAEFRVESWTK